MNVDRRRTFSLGIALFVLSVRPTAADQQENPVPIQYNRDIRPILAENCFACHGPDAGHREAGLRLDTAHSRSVEADSGLLAISPGRSHESELMVRVTSQDPSVKMPPPSSHKTLTAEQIRLLKRWIDAGAEYEDHWSFLPVKKPVLLDSQGASVSARRPIDEIVLKELAEQGLQAAPQADPVTLVRRLAFDLTGLPPTPEQVEMLAIDQSDSAYETVVDQLMASPRFGERMAMWWLDLVRYADSVGYHGDQAVDVYPFREWVINSFNENKPFDEFTREQLGGDLLPNPDLAQRIAAGYNRLGMMTQEGGAQPKEYLAKYAAERVRNIGGAWLGLTTGCCECHDHKFDPLTARDFYRLAAFFADIQEQGLYTGGTFGPTTLITNAEQSARLASLDARIAELNRQLNEITPEFKQAQTDWEARLQDPVQWIVLKPLNAESTQGTILSVREGGEILASGPNPAKENFLVRFSGPIPNLTALRLDALPDASFPEQGPGRSSNGNFVLSEIVATQHKDNSEVTIPLVNASASFEQDFTGNGNPYGKWSIRSAIAPNASESKLGWAILPQTGKTHGAVLKFKSPLNLAESEELTIKLSFHSEHAQHTLGHFRISGTTVVQPPAPWAVDQLPKNIREILSIEESGRDNDQNAELTKYYRSIAPMLEPVRAQLATVQQERVEFQQTLPTMLATIQVEPRVVRVLPRGNWMDESGEVVLPGTPEFLPQIIHKEGRLNRLDLADWLVSPENPLTARTFVNRIWHLLFGAGISRKLDDLGAQGDWPTHPQLIDLLAADFIKSGWNVKQLIKEIVMSETYRRTSRSTPELDEKDPFNFWLARQGRFRLDAEVIRDNALWISGLLEEKVGGPSVKPYQPPRYWAYLNFPEREWGNDQGANLYRRGLYTHWQRQYLHPSLLAFDAPNREECTALRVRSNTPLQSLVLLNDPTYVEAARAFAELIIRSGDSRQQRFDFAYQRALSRSINASEAAVLSELLDQHSAEYRNDPESASSVLKNGVQPPPADQDAVELAAWTSVARVILNLHSTITRN
ncbi:PSD1 and planctomycete cytochrome C domain-containing protein [Planctomicrobium sp. SH661]|uniref:PSD1 and planctomycete cytochrome C domain-containing protein n=1 Tax=Planctomicrobium sp. SH661 TaxID=3448124 RepID=UPI003F5B493D